MTKTGTTVKSFQIEERSVMVGSNFGIGMVPFISFTMVIPAVMTTNNTANAIDKADVQLNESARSSTNKSV